MITIVLKSKLILQRNCVKNKISGVISKCKKTAVPITIETASGQEDTT
jgi:hypothetical protein